jgi:hypothetical protein
MMVGEEDGFFNTGVILARQSPTVHALLNATWQKDRYLSSGAWEQDAFLDLAVEFPEFLHKLLIAPPRRMQAIPPEYVKKFANRQAYAWQPNDFCVHFFSSQVKGAEFQALMAKYIPPAG